MSQNEDTDVMMKEAGQGNNGPQQEMKEEKCENQTPMPGETPPESAAVTNGPYGSGHTSEGMEQLQNMQQFQGMNDMAPHPPLHEQLGEQYGIPPHPQMAQPGMAAPGMNTMPHPGMAAPGMNAMPHPGMATPGMNAMPHPGMATPGMNAMPHPGMAAPGMNAMPHPGMAAPGMNAMPHPGMAGPQIQGMPHHHPPLHEQLGAQYGVPPQGADAGSHSGCNCHNGGPGTMGGMFGDPNGLFGMFGNMINNNPNLSAISQMVNATNSDLVKGIAIGAGLALLMSSDLVKDLVNGVIGEKKPEETSTEKTTKGEQ